MSDELSTRAGERRNKANLLLDQDGVAKKCFEKLRKYSETLGTNLLAKVYDAEDKKLINSIRVFWIWSLWLSSLSYLGQLM